MMTDPAQDACEAEAEKMSERVAGLGFVLRIESGNAQMSEPAHVVAALRGVANAIEDGHLAGLVYDRNGNRVGAWALAYLEDAGG